MSGYRKDRPLVLLSGGVGGARLARGLVPLCSRLTTVVNTGDDEQIYGLHVSPDIDTVLYTLAGIAGPQGWGISNDVFTIMGHLADLGLDTRFQIGDRDFATNLYRTYRLSEGAPLSVVTSELAKRLGVATPVLPATDDLVPTRIKVEGEWISFQEYFVHRSHRDPVDQVEFSGAANSLPAPGVLAALEEAEAVLIAPSNPPLSIWPILAIPGIRQAVDKKERVVCVSPLIGGKALKGPADRVMQALGLGSGNQSVINAYEGLVSDLVVHTDDAEEHLTGVTSVHATDTLIAQPAAAGRFSEWLLGLF